MTSEKVGVSIITPVYNSEQFLGESLKSVVAQDYQDWEMILVDDNSDDKSFEIMEGFKSMDRRFKIFRNSTNMGSGYSRNKAIELARGKYIAFLDSDDLWHPNKLSRHISFMKAKNANFSHTSYGYINERGEVIKNTFHVSKSPVKYNDLLKRTEISCLTAMYDSDKIGKYYMSDHRRKQDYALWLDILKSGNISYGLDEELAFYRQRKGSSTNKKWRLISGHAKFLRETQKFGLLKSIYFTIFWMFNGLVRYYIK